MYTFIIGHIQAQDSKQGATVGHMHKTLFRAEQPTDTLVVSWYPLAGNDENTGPRYEQEARLTGFDILGVMRPGSNTSLRDPALRRSLSPEYFDQRFQAQAAELRTTTEHYGKVIFRGQSSGSFPVLGMVKSGLVRATHLLIEDGINLRLRPNLRTQSPLRARAAWAVAGAQEHFRMPRPPEPDWEAPPFVPAPGKFGEFRTELYHWSRLWRSSYSRESILEIAQAQPRLPILCKFLGHTATATPRAIQDFRHEMEEIKQTRRTTPPAASIRVDYDPSGWHGYLVYPAFGVANLRQVAAMRSYVR